MWFGAEESGLLGSEHYVASLPRRSATDRGMLNFDMVGSPNFVRFVYDGDLSDSAFPADETLRPRRARLGDRSRSLPRLLPAQGLADGADRVRRASDYGPFIDAGIPAGGLFTGAEGYQDRGAGGDLRWHCRASRTTPATTSAATTFGNLSTRGARADGDAAAHATYVLAQSPKLPRGTAPAAAPGRCERATRSGASALHGPGAEVSVR